ncbi:ABC transporter permease [Spirochaetota bacterium]
MRSLMRILTLADKEWIQIRRDSRSLILSIILPVLLILLFGYAITVDVTNVQLAILDNDKSNFSRKYIEKFAHTEYLTIRKYVNSYKEIDKLINSNEIVIAIVIPIDFTKRFKAGKISEVQVLVDGSDSTTATISLGYIKAITYDFNREIQENELKQIGISKLRLPIDVRTRIWYNSELKSKNFIIPGLAILILAIISALITSLTISKEWERGTMETLITTPVRKYEVIFGKLLPYLFIGIFDVIASFSIGFFVFNVPFAGSFVEMCIISMLFLVGTSGLGMLISSATRSQVLSVQFAMVITFLPTFLLSGFIFPIRNMPIVVQGITYLIPARYMMVVVKGIALKGIGYQMLWTQIIFLLIFAIIVIFLSIKKFTLTIPES